MLQKMTKMRKKKTRRKSEGKKLKNPKIRSGPKKAAEAEGSGGRRNG